MWLFTGNFFFARSYPKSVSPEVLWDSKGKFIPEVWWDSKGKFTT